MIGYIRALVERLKARLATDAALDLEAQILAASAARKAALLRLAEEYESEGFPGVAAELRRQAQDLDPHRPLDGALRAIDHLQTDPNRLRIAEGTGAAPSEPEDGPVLLPHPHKTDRKRGKKQ
jgi:hypothetical protein